MDITWLIELLIIIVVFFSKKYWIPLLKGTVILRVARTLTSAANELYITGEITDKAQWVWDEIVDFLNKYKITFLDCAGAPFRRSTFYCGKHPRLAVEH